ncbi:RNA-binding protein 4B-like [Ciona intestinalis]
MVKIFVGRLPEDVKKSELEELFKAYGEITDCSILKNYGFVHMADLNDAKKAIAGLDKTDLKGNSINVELSTTKVQKASKIFVGNLPPETKSADIHKLFKKYGTVIECDVVKNYAFVHMGRENMARDAINGLNNTEFNGNKIGVQMARSQRNLDMHGGPPMYRGDMRGRGRGGRGVYMGPPPRMGLQHPRFRKPYLDDPYLDPPFSRMGRGGLRHRMLGGSSLHERSVGLGSMYGQDLLSRAALRRDPLLSAGGSLLLREREALARRLESEALAE